MMKPIMFSNGIVNLAPELFDYIEHNFISSIIYYVIDSRQREAVGLSNWLKEQIESPEENVMAVASLITAGNDYDEQVFHVMRWVQNNLKYVGDFAHWTTAEKWSPAHETIAAGIGDCEDGAILSYVLCRFKGVPANRLLIWTGNVQASTTSPEGGHACLFYKPNNFPLNFVSLDWCYYPVATNIAGRSVFEFYDKEVTEYVAPDLAEIMWSAYRSSWFLFNEDIAYSKYLLKTAAGAPK